MNTEELILECSNDILQKQYFWSYIDIDKAEEGFKLKAGISYYRNPITVHKHSTRVTAFGLDKTPLKTYYLDNQGYIVAEHGTTGVNFEVAVFSYELEKIEDNFIMTATEINDQALKNQLIKNIPPLRDMFIRNLYARGWLIKYVPLAESTNFIDRRQDIFYYIKFNYEVGVDFYHYMDKNGIISEFNSKLDKLDVNISDISAIFYDRFNGILLKPIEIVHSLSANFYIKGTVVADGYYEIQEKYPKFWELINA